MKFEDLNNQLASIEDNSSDYHLNDKGKELLLQYNKFIDTLKQWVQPEAVINVISLISSEEKGTSLFKVANRLDTITNGGKTNIDSQFAFNNEDDIMEYIEK